MNMNMNMNMTTVKTQAEESPGVRIPMPGALGQFVGESPMPLTYRNAP